MKRLLTDRFVKALEYGAELHRKQTRKGTRIPYVAHLLGVAGIVLEAGGNEDEAIAALLHDAVEDQGGLKTLKEIRKRFGSRVAKIVREGSDSESEDPHDKPSWHERKRAYLRHLAVASKGAVLVSIADKLHNARAILADYRIHRDNLWKRFNKEATKADQPKYYRSLVTAFRGSSAPRPLVVELDPVVCELERLAA
jgi:(p)ppGpp synthase/HD superfamily hydrolase